MGKTLYAMAELHPENLSLSRSGDVLKMEDLLYSLMSAYGDETIMKWVTAAIKDPNWIGLTPFDEAIRDIARYAKRAVYSDMALKKIIAREKNIISEINPSVFYLEGVNCLGGVKLYNAPHIAKAIEGKKVINLDEGCASLYEMALEIDEDNPEYGETHKKREICWCKEIVENLPADGENGLLKVGYNHLKPNKYGFGQLVELLESEGIEVQVIHATADVSFFDKLNPELLNPTNMRNI